MSDEADSSAPAVPLWRRLSRRAWIAIGIAVFLLIVRVALPTIAQQVIESQGSKYLEGQLVVENVDLWLLSGAAALEGVALWPDGEVPEEGETPGDPALVAWDRIYVDIAWLPLFDEIANVQDFELDGLSVNVARLHDGTLVIPDLRELPEEDEEPDDDTDPFGVLIDRAALLNARLRVRDDVPSAPTYRELKLPSIEVRDLAVGDDEATEPGHIVVQAGLRDGTIRIDARVAERDAGFETSTQIDIQNLPLDQLHVHEPTLGWTKSVGRLDLSMHVAVDAQARVVLSGITTISDLSIEVPNEKEPGLAWKRFSVEINQVDVANQNVDLALVALDGGNVLVRPLQQPPIPILPEELAAAAEASPEPLAEPAQGAAPEATPEPAAETTLEGDDEVAVAKPVDETAPETGATEEDAPLDWTIRLAALEITDTAAGVILEQGPASGRIGKLSVTDVDATTTTWSVGAVDLTDSFGSIDLPTGSAEIEIVSLALTGLTSDPSKPIHVVAKIKEDASVIDVAANLVQEPLAATANVSLENVALGRYADLSGASPVHIPTGTLQASLAIETDGENATVAGQIAIDELQVLTQDGEDDFSLAWESLLLDIRTLEAVVTDPEAPMNLELTELRLTGPKIRATLTKDGIVLPTVRETEGSSAEPSPEPADGSAESGDATVPTASETPRPPEGEAQADAEEPAPGHEPVIQDGLVAQTESVGVDEIREFAEPAANLPVGLVVDRLRIEDGTFRVVDRSVKPTYRGKITDFRFEITGLELPYDAPPIDTVFEKMSLDLRAPGNAPVKIRAGTESKGVQVNANIEKLPLTQFNPYVTQASGYTVLDGAATVESSVLWTKERYKTDTDVTLGSLDVGTQSGGTLFQDYFGIPITAALALMRDVTGTIGLGIPVSGSMTEGAEVGIGSVVGQAITKAILNAITSPLKMLSVVTMIGGKVGDLAPAPIPFEPGSAKIAKSSREQVEKIGEVLASTPAIKVEFIGRTTAADVRALKEEAVLEDMQGESGFFGGIRNLASGGTRNAIRKALEDGDTSTLSDEHRAALDELASEKEVTEQDLDNLATARAQTLYDAFIDDGVTKEQMAIGTSQPSRDDGAPDVLINLLQRG